MALRLQIRTSRARPDVFTTSVKFSCMSGGPDQSTEKVLSERKLEYGKRSLNMPSVGPSPTGHSGVESSGIYDWAAWNGLKSSGLDRDDIQ
jgi:hypothetical protein